MLRLRSLFVAAACVVSTLPAQLATWRQPGVGLWSSAVNWEDSVLPAPGSAVLFRPRGLGVFQSTNDLGPLSLGGLNFDAPRGYFGSFQASGPNRLISTGELSFTQGAQIYQELATGSVYLQAPIRVNGAFTINGPSLHLAGPIHGSGVLRVFDGILGNAAAPVNSTFTGTVQLSGSVLLDDGTAFGSATIFPYFASLGATSSPSERTLTIANAFDLEFGVTLAGYGGLRLDGELLRSGSVQVVGANGVVRGLTSLQLTAASSRFFGDLSVSGESTVRVSINGADGSLASVRTVGVHGGAVLEIDDRQAGATRNRLADNAPVTLGGGSSLVYRSAGGRTGIEAVGALRTAGWSRVVLNPDAVPADTSARLNIAAFEPAPGSLTFFGGRNLGLLDPGTTGADHVFFGNSAAVLASQVGGGGAAGTTTMSILPQAVAASGLANENAFATYDPSRGVRALLANEVASTIVSGSSSFANVRLLAPAVIDAPTQINALALDAVGGASPQTGRVSGSGRLTVASGLVLLGPAAAGSISVAELDFAGRPGIIATTAAAGIGAGTSISSRITASGLTIAGTGSLSLTGNNQIDGRIVIAAPVVASSVAALGGTGEIEIQGGSLNVTGTLGRDIIATPAGGRLGPSGGGAPLILTGVIGGRGELTLGDVTLTTSALQGPLRFDGRVTLTSGGPAGEMHALLGPTNAELRVDGPTTLYRLTLSSSSFAGMLPLVANADLTVSRLNAADPNDPLASGFVKRGPARMSVQILDVRGPITVEQGFLSVGSNIPPPGSSAPAPITIGTAGGFWCAEENVGIAVRRDVVVNGTLGGLEPSFVTGGRMRIIGRLTLNSGAAMRWGNISGNWMSVAATSIAFSGGVFTLRLDQTRGSFGAPDSQLLLFHSEEGISGTLPTFVLDFTGAPEWASLGLSVQQFGNDLYLVPEPSVLVWLGWALAGLAGAVRVRRRR